MSCNFEGHGVSLELPLVQCSSYRVYSLGHGSFKEVPSLEEVGVRAPFFSILILRALLSSLLTAVIPPRVRPTAAGPLFTTVHPIHSGNQCLMKTYHLWALFQVTWIRGEQTNSWH